MAGWHAFFIFSNREKDWVMKMNGMRIVRDEQTQGNTAKVISMYSYDPATVLRQYTGEELEYFMHRAMDDEEYEMCGVIKQILGSGNYRTAA